MRYIIADEIIFIKKQEFTMLYHRKLYKYYKLSHSMADFLLKFVEAFDYNFLTIDEQKKVNSLIDLNILVPCDASEKTKCKIREVKGKYPLSLIQLEITKRCNFNCIHCYLGTDKQTYNQYMEKETVFQIIDEASLLGVFEFNITGGEPLLHPDIKDILVHVYDKGMRTRLYTNGYLINDDYIELFKKLDIYRVRISVDGINQETHDTIRGIKSFKKIQDNIDKLTQAGIHVEITTTLMKNNLGDIHKLIQQLKNKERIDHITDVYISEDKDDPLKITETEYVDAIKERFVHWSYCESSAKSERSHCGIADDFLYIASDGTGKLCPTLPKSYDIGNVLENGLKSVWDTVISRYYQKVICSKKNECKYAKVCDGGCRSRALYNYGSLDSEDTYMCELYRYLLDKE